MGTGYEIDAITAVLVGGAALTGGKGTVSNTVIEAFVIGILNNILNLLAIPSYHQMILKGLKVLVTVVTRKEH